MRTREEVLQYALSFPNVYEERPFRDQGWQLVRVKGEIFGAVLMPLLLQGIIRIRNIGIPSF